MKKQDLLRFYVYKHVFILNNDHKITRYFITLRDINKTIVAFTDFHKYIRSGRCRKSVKVTSSSETKFYAVSKLLNYVFFDSDHKVKSLNDVTADMIKEYLNDYGLARLEGDIGPRMQATVDASISAIIDFFSNYLAYASRNGIKTHLHKEDLVKKEKHYSKKHKRFEEIVVPAFKVAVLPKERHVFRDIFDSVFEIIMDTIIEHDPDILMLAACSAFAGMRPSESCNVFRSDSPLGEGIKFILYDGKVDSIAIDLSFERQLRSDSISVGNIKKERTQCVYPEFIVPFMNCYNIYMEHMKGRYYEEAYAPLTVNSYGKAMTYKTYRNRFHEMIKLARKKMLQSNDPKVVAYGKQLGYTPIGPHIFRHWFSVKLTMFGEDTDGLMFWRGDKSPDSALTYLANKSELTKQLNDVSSTLFDYNMWKAELTYGRS